MSDVLERYARGEGPIPATQLAWYIYGAGMENVGCEAQPEEIPIASPNPDQLLARLDASSICFSDLKIIKQGGSHPRLFGRDLARDPIIAGHEVAVTLVQVGEQLRDQYRVGERYVVQADIYYRGKNLAFGYMLPGGFEQYVLLGEEVLRGDDGVYLLPVAPETGYAEAGLAEPWACVVCAYRTDFRRTPAAGGTAWIIGCEAAEGFTLGALAQGPAPARVLLTGVPEDLAAQVRQVAAGAEVEVIEVPAPADPAAVQQQYAPEGFDDLILLGSPSPELVEAASATLGRLGVLSLLTDQPLARPVEVDLGRIHYDYTRYYGATGRDLSAAYTGTRSPGLITGGKAWISGGGGPMGQMHVQIAAQASDGPAVIVVSDLDDERLELLRERFEPLARERGRELILLNPRAMGQEAFEARLREIAPEGFDDLHVLVPVPALIAGAVPWTGREGLVEIFAGIPRGSLAPVDLSPVALRGMRFQGTSGSTIEDLRTTLQMTESGEIDTNTSVAAIGGIGTLYEGLVAVQEMTFPGKIVIYPQLTDLPLTPLTELPEKLPQVAAKLGPGGTWTREAERALLEALLPA